MSETCENMTRSLVDTAPATRCEELPARQPEPRVHPWLGLATGAALVCSSLEIELLEQLDSLSKYMTLGEIAWDSALALLVLLGLTVAWWLFGLLLVGTANLISRTERNFDSLFWHFALILPFSYFILDLFGAIRLELFPHWFPELTGWLALSVAFLVSASVCIYRVNVPKMQTFCRNYLAPVGYIHFGLAAVAALSLLGHGIHLYHDYARAGNTVAKADLPDIYVITVDALRAEDMSVYGYARPTTPNLDRFAQNSFTFESFFANSNFTTPSTTSIETGKLPWSHRVFHLGGFLRLKAEKENLAELLRQQGYYTATVSSNYLATPILHRTLASYDASQYCPPENAFGTSLRYSNFLGLNTLHTFTGPLLSRLVGVRFYLETLIWSQHYPSPAEPVFERARTLVERNDISQPRFVWMHILPPHDPYLAPPPYQGRFLPGDKLTRAYNFLGLRNTTKPHGTTAADLRARYDEMILYADHEVGEFLDWLDQTHRMDRSIVIISADHGESFEHGWYLHSGRELFNGVIHIPLLIHLPGQKKAGRISYPAEQSDLLPTILDLLGRRAPPWTDGMSLKPLFEGETLPDRYIMSMNLESNSEFDPISRGTLAIMDAEYKYVLYLDSKAEVLYDYKRDEAEEHDLIGAEPEVATRMRDALLSKLRDVNNKPLLQR